MLFGLTFFILYNIFFYGLNDWQIPESISATSYMSMDVFGTTFPFTLLCLISAITLFPSWIAVSPQMLQWLPFISCSGMIFAGSTPLFKGEFEGKIHNASGIVAFVAGMLWLVLTSNWITLGAIIAIGGIWTLFDYKNYTFIFEIISYIFLCVLILFLS